MLDDSWHAGSLAELLEEARAAAKFTDLSAWRRQGFSTELHMTAWHRAFCCKGAPGGLKGSAHEELRDCTPSMIGTAHQEFKALPMRIQGTAHQV